MRYFKTLGSTLFFVLMYTLFSVAFTFFMDAMLNHLDIVNPQIVMFTLILSLILGGSILFAMANRPVSFLLGFVAVACMGNVGITIGSTIVMSILLVMYYGFHKLLVGDTALPGVGMNFTMTAPTGRKIENVLDPADPDNFVNPISPHFVSASHKYD